MITHVVLRRRPRIEYRDAMDTPPTRVAEIDTIDYDELVVRRDDRSVAVVDVLPPTTYRHSHIPGARNLPLAQVLELAADVLPDRQQEVILYCASFT